MAKRKARLLAATLTRNNPLGELGQKRLFELERLDAEREAKKQRWFDSLLATKRIVVAAGQAYRAGVYKALEAVYGLYVEVEGAEALRDEFYIFLREKLRSQGFKLQSNTSDAALLFRTIFSKSMSHQRISGYVKVLLYARDLNVGVSDFTAWLKKETITRAARQRDREKDEQDREIVRKERHRRARILVLRYLEWRETQPFAVHTMLAWQAQRYLGSQTNLCVMVGTAVRRFDRESDFADVFISHILPPSLELDIVIVDRWAKSLSGPMLEDYERKADEMGFDKWGAEFNSILWNFDVLQAEKASQYWRNRQQAALAENQVDFNRSKRSR